MSHKAGRNFTIFDALVLMAATAVGMAGSRSLLFLGGWLELERPGDGWSFDRALFALARAVWLSQSCLLAWTLALLALRCRQPRPPLRRLALQPGTVVCIATVLGMAEGTLELLARWALCWVIKREDWWRLNTDLNQWDSVPLGAWFRIHDWVITRSEYIAFGIVLAWIVLALSRRCRPEPSWLDRAGRILGLLWITAAVGSWYLGEVNSLDLIAGAPAPMPQP